MTFLLRYFGSLFLLAARITSISAPTQAASRKQLQLKAPANGCEFAPALSNQSGVRHHVKCRHLYTCCTSEFPRSQMSASSWGLPACRASARLLAAELMVRCRSSHQGMRTAMFKSKPQQQKTHLQRDTRKAETLFRICSICEKTRPHTVGLRHTTQAASQSNTQQARNLASTWQPRHEGGGGITDRLLDAACRSIQVVLRLQSTQLPLQLLTLSFQSHCFVKIRVPCWKWPKNQVKLKLP